MSELNMPAMRYALTRVSGDIQWVATPWGYLIRSWLIDSADEPKEAPALEIFLDKEKATDYSHLNWSNPCDRETGGEETFVWNL